MRFLDLIEDLLRNANTTGSGQGFNASSDIDAIANYIVLGADHVAQVDSDTYLETALRRINGISLCDRLLNLNPAFHGRQGAEKLDQKPFPIVLISEPPCFGKIERSSRRCSWSNSSATASLRWVRAL
jgi:hypothetical protein